MPMELLLTKTGGIMAENLTPNLWYPTYLRGAENESKAAVNVREMALLLPHGSGFDSSWHISIRNNGDVDVWAEYHEMNGNGMYTGWITLRARVCRVRKDVLHPLKTPGFAQVVYRKGDVMLKTLTRGDLGDYFHEALSYSLRDLLSRVSNRGAIHVESGQTAVWADGEWRRAAPEHG